MPEYCGVISKSPTVKAVKTKIEEEEGHFDFAILDRVVREARNVDIRTIAEEAQEQVTEVETVAEFAADEVILDIRSIDEQEEKPLQLAQVEVKPLPFYKLSSQFGDLDQSKTYLLYCDRGVMSRLQALYLLEQGYANVKSRETGHIPHREQHMLLQHQRRCCADGGNNFSLQVHLAHFFYQQRAIAEAFSSFKPTRQDNGVERIVNDRDQWGISQQFHAA
uniref:Rhodanese domain-containing protein n=1 Tax=Anopheles maculatus TaxID=74869 RepID=A0A182SSH3_9DIPT